MLFMMINDIAMGRTMTECVCQKLGQELPSHQTQVGLNFIHKCNIKVKAKS